MLAAFRDKGLVLAGVATLVGVALLIGLGTWQMQRLAWKQGLLGSIAERVHAKPVSPAVVEERAREGGDIEYTRVSFNGVFDNDREIHLYALSDAGAPGFHVITPMRLAGGDIVLVNRGFVPNDLKDPARRAAGQLTGDATVTGLVRHPDQQGMFIPSNDPARNIWYWRDVDAMATAAEGGDAARVHRFIVDAEAEPKPPGGWPSGGVTRLTLPNRHLEYAMTWYGLAAALFAVFIAFAAVRLRAPAAR